MQLYLRIWNKWEAMKHWMMRSNEKKIVFLDLSLHTLGLLAPQVNNH